MLGCRGANIASEAQSARARGECGTFVVNLAPKYPSNTVQEQRGEDNLLYEYHCPPTAPAFHLVGSSDLLQQFGRLAAHAHFSVHVHLRHLRD